jgi:hypothetical protein
MATAASGRTGSYADTEVPLPGAQRCSDAEREQASAVLRAAAGESRLTLAEVEERLAVGYAARYRHELAAITADLPSGPPTSGWPAIVALAVHQLGVTLATLRARMGGLSRRGKVVLALALLLVVAGLVFLAVYGFGDEPRHGPGRGLDND